MRPDISCPMMFWRRSPNIPEHSPISMTAWTAAEQSGRYSRPYTVWLRTIPPSPPGTMRYAFTKSVHAARGKVALGRACMTISNDLKRWHISGAPSAFGTATSEAAQKSAMTAMTTSSVFFWRRRSFGILDKPGVDHRLKPRPSYRQTFGRSLTIGTRRYVGLAGQPPA